MCIRDRGCAAQRRPGRVVSWKPMELGTPQAASRSRRATPVSVGPEPKERVAQPLGTALRPALPDCPSRSRWRILREPRLSGAFLPFGTMGKALLGTMANLAGVIIQIPGRAREAHASL